MQNKMEKHFHLIDGHDALRYYRSRDVDPK